MKLITELKDTVELMNSADYKDRFIAEYLQLKIRIDKLARVVDNYDSRYTCSKTLLSEQLQAMCSYMNYLRLRIDLEYTDEERKKYEIPD